MTIKCNFFLWAFLLIGLPLFSQTYYFDNYGVKDGLSQSTVYCATQDDNGDIWIGNKTGISLFDGNTFKNYSIKDGIAGNGARCLYQDTSGTIWFGHLLGGVSRYKNGEFLTISFDSIKLDRDITDVMEDDKGRIWISTAGNGVMRINNPQFAEGEKMEFNRFASQQGLSEGVFDIAMIDGELLFVTDAGIRRYMGSEDKFENYAPENLSTFFQFTTLYQDSKKNIWYGTYNGGLYKQNAETRKIDFFDVRHGLAGNWISCLSEDAEGRVWAGTWGGGVSAIDANNRIKTFNTQNGLPDLSIFAIMQDMEGNMLIGTKENGLYLFKGEHFVSYTEKNGISNNQVWAVQKDRKGRTWVGTSHGITIIEEIDGVANYSYINEENNRFIGNNVQFLEMDENGFIWAGVYGGGVIRIDPENPAGPYYYPGRLNGYISYQFVTAMDIDKHNNLWVGTIDGLLYYEIESGRMSRLTNVHGLPGNDISEVYGDKEGQVWVGCKGRGLAKIVDTTVTVMDLGGDITPSIIREDRQKNLWVGTDGQGLFISKDRESITEQFTIEDGLLANLINLLEVDEDNNIWIGTNKGLNKFDRENTRFVAYTEQDGFTGIETKPKASFLDASGSLWFGTVNGLIKYDPSKDKTNSLLPVIRITDISVNLNDYKWSQGDEFSYTEKSFYFNFKGIYLTNPKSVRYRYMLEGIDPDWSAPTDLTFANYPALPDGKYTFKVMASNNSGKWSEVPATYTFQINPPFWKTWYFYVFCVIFFGSWIVFLIKKREENLQREKKILEEKVAERTAEIQEKNKELASKNKDITDSIRYAERIQRAILPPDDLVQDLFPDSFVFYRPKDIVSGDFYWVSSSEGQHMFSAVDCTGHGVPGAFMSIVGHNLLDKIVKEEKILQPSLILDHLNNAVSDTLRQRSDSNEVKDGMDLGLVSINAKQMKMQYSGAHNPMYICRKGELIETKADKFAIGSFIRGEKRIFTNHEYDLEKGDVIYVFSDGFPDQFGGPNGKKYKYRPFKEFILANSEKPMQEQMKLLEEEFIRWLGNHEQIDDVIIFGVRV